MSCLRASNEWHEVVFLPYITTEKLEFAGLTLCSWNSIKASGELPEDVSGFLSWYFDKYRDLTMKPLDPAMIRYNTLLGPWTQEDLTYMCDCIDLIAFLSLWDNHPFFPLSSNSFVMYHKQFTPNDRSLAISSGSYRESCITPKT